MNTLQYILNKFQIQQPSEKLPIEIPNFGRNQMAELFCELNFKVGLELGVESGAFSNIICKANPGVKLYCVDAWVSYGEYRHYVSQETIDAFYENAKKTLAPYNTKLIKGLSMDVVETFVDESLDFVFIDGNHTYDFVTQDVTEWSKKVRPGGIVSGHDYIRKASQNNGVIEALRDFTELNKIDPWFVLGRKETIPGEIRDKSRTWMYVK